MLADETPTLTGMAATFEAAPAIATSELRPDGLLRTTTPAALGQLAPPWSLLRHEAVFDGKMPGDHLGPEALQRGTFRREARQAQRLAQNKGEARVDPHPDDCAAWLLAPYVPAWLRAWERAGRLTLVAAGEGCWWVTPAMFPVLWIAANELPLREELIPFLGARTGAKLAEFVAWVRGRRTPEWFSTRLRGDRTSRPHDARRAATDLRANAGLRGDAAGGGARRGARRSVFVVVRSRAARRAAPRATTHVEAVAGVYAVAGRAARSGGGAEGLARRAGAAPRRPPGALAPAGDAHGGRVRRPPRAPEAPRARGDPGAARARSPAARRLAAVGRSVRGRDARGARAGGEGARPAAAAQRRGAVGGGSGAVGGGHRDGRGERGARPARAGDAVGGNAERRRGRRGGEGARGAVRGGDGAGGGAA